MIKTDVVLKATIQIFTALVFMMPRETSVTRVRSKRDGPGFLSWAWGARPHGVRDPAWQRWPVGRISWVHLSLGTHCRMAQNKARSPSLLSFDKLTLHPPHLAFSPQLPAPRVTGLQSYGPQGPLLCWEQHFIVLKKCHRPGSSTDSLEWVSQALAIKPRWLSDALALSYPGDLSVAYSADPEGHLSPEERCEFLKFFFNPSSSLPHLEK